MELLSLIPVIGTALAWRRWQDITAASAILHAVSAILLVLFLGSLVGLLLPTTLLLMIVGTALAAMEGYRLIRQKNPLPVPVGMLALLCIAFWTVHSGSSYFFYDEYSHWGIFLKEMLASNQLWAADTNSMHPRYLPGTSLWQYFFAVFSRNPEGAAYLAQLVLLIAPLLVLWEKTNWRQLIWHVGILVFVVIAVTNFGHGFVSLYVDHLLGAWFAGVLLNFLLETKRRRFPAHCSYLSPLAVIVLIKTTGIFFAVAAAGIIALLLLASDTSETAGRTITKRLRHAVILPVATIVLSLSILFVWDINRDATGVEADGTSSGGVISGLLARDSLFDSAQQAELTRRFMEVLLHQQISKDKISAQFNAYSYPLTPLYEDSFRLTTASLLGLSLIAFLCLWRFVLPPEYRRTWAIAAGCTWLTTVAYIGVLYLVYRYLSGDSRGLELSSYVRYAHSMLLPVVLFLFAPLLPAFAGSGSRRLTVAANLKTSLPAMIFSFLLVALLVFERPYLKPLYSVQQPPALRTQLAPITRELRAKIDDARLWVFFPNVFGSDFSSKIVTYELTPGRTFVEEDATMLQGNQAALKKELSNWEYAWFVLQDPVFDEALERLTGSPVTARVFRISNTTGNLTLEPVPDLFHGGN